MSTGRVHDSLESAHAELTRKSPNLAAVVEHQRIALDALREAPASSSRAGSHADPLAPVAETIYSAVLQPGAAADGQPILDRSALEMTHLLLAREAIQATGADLAAPGAAAATTAPAEASAGVEDFDSAHLALLAGDFGAGLTQLRERGVGGQPISTHAQVAILADCLSTAGRGVFNPVADPALGALLVEDLGRLTAE
ncbi:hypothetical protein H696_03560 [Fonticula alba]|uniref:Uncharacterized protein n=1 Tax=Fonticula alba TaxID=691883 RepID=A0A058Z859_FONAL|nr:hypothetical protein H696_03560 [Fonticula alba]KCV70098.1 hypothetical protein H696_03560 [Fonticula alba]|eukprot:XP_009495704.1 hypothetical protein H696_03560 [Fonticula alba]